jgi:hypothetical protein
MNSSIVSVAQSNRSGKALVLHEFAKTIKHTSRFKMALMLTIVVLLVTSVIPFRVISSSVAYNKRLSHYVNLVGDIRHSTQSLLFTNITGVGWEYVVPSGQNLGSPLLNAERAINKLEFVENSLIFGNSDEGIHSTSIVRATTTYYSKCMSSPSPTQQGRLRDSGEQGDDPRLAQRHRLVHWRGRCCCR